MIQTVMHDPMYWYTTSADLSKRQNQKKRHTRNETIDRAIVHNIFSVSASRRYLIGASPTSIELAAEVEPCSVSLLKPNYEQYNRFE